MQSEQHGILFSGISKEFDGKYALRDINLFFEEGLIHCIVGENGAGKSTLMNLLSGVHQPTTGKILLNGEEIIIRSPKDAVACRIGMIHQHFMIIDTLTVWQNIILGNEPTQLGLVHKSSAMERIEKVSADFGLNLPIETFAGSLTVGQQQRVEILKVLYQDAKYIVFDEPTAVLTPSEADRLLESISHLKTLGKTILFISHKLDEVVQIADTVTVLRDGINQGKVPADTISQHEIVQKMVGRDIDLPSRAPSFAIGDIMLRTDKICIPKRQFQCGLSEVSLEVRRGEILGLAGVDGNGQQQLVEALLGITPLASGQIILGGEDITGKPTAYLRKERIACIPPDRHLQGSVLELSILRNMVLGCETSPVIRRSAFLNRRKIQSLVEERVKKYDIKYASLDQPVKGLSGGNQQKVILFRECEWKGTQLIIASNPTRGLDVGAIEFVYRKLNELKTSGRAILLISTELSEIMALSDRIAVLYDGYIAGTMDNNESITAGEIGYFMSGLKEGVHA